MFKILLKREHVYINFNKKIIKKYIVNLKRIYNEIFKIKQKIMFCCNKKIYKNIINI